MRAEGRQSGRPTRCAKERANEKKMEGVRDGTMYEAQCARIITERFYVH